MPPWWFIIASVAGSVISATLGTLAFVARLVFTGRLVPKSLHDQVRDDRDARVTRAEKMADEYKSANTALLETTARQTSLLQTISETTKTTHALIIGFQQAAQRSAEIRGQEASPRSSGGERVA
jgi:hypothetical protein